MALILVRYGEIGTKSRQVRKRFRRRLRENVQDKLRSEHIDGATVRENNRLFVRVSDDVVDAAVNALTFVPGITSVSPVAKTEADYDAIFTACKPFINAAPDSVDTFGLRTRRVGDHDFSSEDVAEHVGQMIVDAYALGVDLDTPDLALFIEVRHSDAYVYTENVSGVGGLPVNDDYRVLTPLTTEADVVAAHLLQKRGCSIIPYAAEDVEQAQEYVGLLHAYDPDVKLVTAETGDVTDLVDVFDAQAVCRGTTVEDIQTGETSSQPEHILVLEPCCGMDTDEVMERFYNL